jgi:hypothetical protein
MHNSSKSCMALMLGRPTNRRHTSGQTMRSDWPRPDPRGLEGVREQPGCRVKARDSPCCRQPCEATIAQELAHDGAIFLLYPRLIVLTVGTRACEFDTVAQAVLDQSFIYKLAAVINVKRSQRERQTQTDALKRFDHQATLADDDRGGLRPPAGDIGQNKTMDEATSIDLPAVSNQVHFHATRRWSFQSANVRILMRQRGSGTTRAGFLGRVAFFGIRSKRSIVAALIDKTLERITSSSFRCLLRSNAGN